MRIILTLIPLQPYIPYNVLDFQLLNHIFWSLYCTQYLYQYNFESFAKTEDFMKHFVVTGNKDLFDVLKVNDTICDDRRSCLCGTLQFLNEICSLVAGECSSKPNCPAPVRPLGHCCDICGKYDLHVNIYIYDISTITT